VFDPHETMTATTNDPKDPHSADKALTAGFNDIETVIAKTMEYLAVPSVVGHEQFFIDYLKKDFEAIGMQGVKHHGLLEIHGDKPHSAIVCAHIDRHGLISLGKGEYAYAAQFIREIKYGEANRASRRELEGLGKRFAGETVFAYDPKTNDHLGEGVIEVCHPLMMMGEALFFIQGMKAQRQGIPVAYARTAREQDGYIKGQIDNALSLGILYALYKNGFQGTTLFSCEEEIGKSWIHIAAWLKKTRIENKTLLVIDTSPFVDAAPIDQGMIILRNRDMSAKFNPALVGALKTRCGVMEIPFQVKDEVLLSKGKSVSQLGSTELGRLVQHTKKKWSGATVQIPTMMYHTSNETTSRLAIRNYFRFLKNILIDDPLPLGSKVKKKTRRPW
jgi:putative aminopeptidase FrvX